MELKDWINISLSISSFILAVISIVTVVLTLRQNNRMIETSTRPYISLYGATTSFSAFQFYLVIKNFGKSSAIITKFYCDIDLSQCTMISNLPIPFENIVGFTLAPNQAIQFPVDYYNMLLLNPNPTFIIKYRNGKKEYREHLHVNLSTFKDYVCARTSNSNKEEQLLTNILQDMVIHKL